MRDGAAAAVSHAAASGAASKSAAGGLVRLGIRVGSDEMTKFTRTS